MTVGKVKRLSNPRRRTAKKKNARRRLSDKQIRHFGTKAQKAALKRRRSTARKSNPKRRSSRPRTHAKTKVVYRTKTVKAKANRKRRRANPLQMVTLGLINPRKGKKVAKTKRRNPRRKSTATTKRRRKNSTRIVVMGRKPNARHRRSNRRRNPSIGGVSGAKGIGELLIGGVAGVTLATATPAFLPAAMTGNTLFSAVSVGAVGWAAGMLVTKMFGNKNIGDGVTLGAWLTAVQQIITSYAPGLGLSGFVPAQFNVPDNPVWAGNQKLLAARAAAAAAATTTTPSMKGVMSAYGGAY